MESEKLEDLLLLSLSASKGQRERSEVLDVGVTRDQNLREVIVKYSGDIDGLQIPGMEIQKLLAGYAIVKLPEDQIGALVAAREIEYVEMPKNLQTGLYEAKRVSCILPLLSQGDEGAPLDGKGVLIAVLDSGIDYRMPDFRKEDGSSRILALWDQELEREFSQEQIDEALQAESRDGALELVPSIDRSGHGTAVAAIAAGSNPNLRLRGAAPGAGLLVVKLSQKQNGYPHTTQLMSAVSWSLSKAAKIGQPLVINISYGNCYGPHDGSSLLCRFLDNAAESGRTAICVGCGNEGAAGGHASGQLEKNVADVSSRADGLFGNLQRERETLELIIGEYERTLNIQLWKNYADVFTVILQAPSGQEIIVQPDKNGRQDVLTNGTEVLVYAGQPSPYSVWQEIFFDLLPRDRYIESGIWTFHLIPEKIVLGSYQLYLPTQQSRSADTRFVRPDPLLTMTIPSTAQKVISVGAIHSYYEAYADFSGRGEKINRENRLMFADSKPDLAAPGVDLLVPTSEGSTQRVSGTSFATPLVSGAAALLMEWGIEKGNDPYLYGEKLKAYLRKGAKKLRGETDYPNERVGYGALCAAQSLPQVEN